jgi:hypothetical protein
MESLSVLLVLGQISRRTLILLVLMSILLEGIPGTLRLPIHDIFHLPVRISRRLHRLIVVATHPTNGFVRLWHGFTGVGCVESGSVLIGHAVLRVVVVHDLWSVHFVGVIAGMVSLHPLSASSSHPLWIVRVRQDALLIVIAAPLGAAGCSDPEFLWFRWRELVPWMCLLVVVAL